MLYETIDELIKKEKKNAAGYCFDEAWLRWLDGSSEPESEIKDIAKEALSAPDEWRSIAIACAAVEIGEKLKRGKCFCGYASDSGGVQQSMYEAMFNRNCDKCEDTCNEYSKDILTNFVYVFKRSIKVLEGADNIWCSGNTGGFGNKGCFSVGYREKFVPISEKLESSALIQELNEFACISSTLGNYGCIPCRLNGQGRINSRKGNAWGTLEMTDGEGDTFYVSDQFALFLKWVELNKRVGDKIDKWKERMRLSCWEKAYADASKKWEKAYRLPDGSEEKLSEYAEYLKIVKQATVCRSNQIIQTI